MVERRASHADVSPKWGSRLTAPNERRRVIGGTFGSRTGWWPSRLVIKWGHGERRVCSYMKHRPVCHGKLVAAIKRHDDGNSIRGQDRPRRQ